MHSPVVWIVPVLVLLLLLGATVLALKLKYKRVAVYEAKPLLSPSESCFYDALLSLYGGTAIVCPKVNLGDLLRVRQGLEKSEWRAARNRIDRKHVDFVVLRPGDFHVVGAIELDDSSHQKQHRIDRDRFVDDALGDAGIKICRVKAQRTYELAALTASLNTAFSEEKGAG